MTTTKPSTDAPQADSRVSPAAVPSDTRRPGRRRRLLKVAAAIVVVFGVYAAYDLYWPRQSKLRDFDPDEVARLDTAMWRSYYSRQRVRLFGQAVELMNSQYHLPPLRSALVSYRAAKAAFVFKDGHSRADYERALPDLLDFFAAIRRDSDIDFDVDRAAKLELEWWIVHRERADHAPGDLDRALAEAAAELYRIPPDRLMEYGRLRAEAMKIRDTKADEGGVTEEDWAKIEVLLRGSWRSLHEAVSQEAGGASRSV